MAAMESRDSLTVLPTGGGKSLCYQAPAVCRDGLAIVVSPLIALMKDQVDQLKKKGILAAFVNSTLHKKDPALLEPHRLKRCRLGVGTLRCAHGTLRCAQR